MIASCPTKILKANTSRSTLLSKTTPSLTSADEWNPHEFDGIICGTNVNINKLDPTSDFFSGYRIAQILAATSLLQIDNRHDNG